MVSNTKCRVGFKNVYFLQYSQFLTNPTSFITFISNCLFVSDFSGSNSVHEVATLYHSARLRNVLDKIDYFSKLVRKTDDIQGPVEADPEYILVRMLIDLQVSCFCLACF